MGLYEELGMADILTQVAQRQLDEGKWKLDNENKIKYKLAHPVNSGWDIKFDNHERDCVRWLHIYFLQLYKKLPPPCMGCFKVVVIPETLTDLFKVHDLQKKMKLHSKCGIEQRAYTPRLYGAYWYAPLGCSIEEAQRLAARVKAEVDKLFSGRVKVLLKRACTEMEIQYGDSDKWQLTEHDEFHFRLFDSVFAQVPNRKESPSFRTTHTLKQWIEFAFEHGDETARKYMDEPLVKPPVDYMNDTHGIGESELEELDYEK